MYPVVRLAFHTFRARRQGAMAPDGLHVSQHICWPWDVDVFLEMNNGRILTLCDLGRFGLAERVGFSAMLKRERWGLAVAGSSVRYRKRIPTFARLEMRTRLRGYDARFFYMEQSLWRAETCCAHVLLRTAVTNHKGLVPTARVFSAWGGEIPEIALPAWVQAWIDADAERPWPPDM